MAHPIIPLHNVSVEDTSRCPIATSCELCGAFADLAVTAALTFAGYHCITVCARCEGADVEDRPALAVLDSCAHHAEHLGLDMDQLAVLSVAYR